MTNQPVSSAEAFDNAASRYDTDSTFIQLSIWFRELVHARMEHIFQPGMHLLELGCGTGEDAIWHAKRGLTITATDASPSMLAETRRKAEAEGLSARVTTREFDFTKPETWQLGELFDGVYSNYGALNCLEDHHQLGAYLAGCVRPGGYAGLCLIGHFCLLETVWHGTHRHFRTATRRFSGRTIAHLYGNYFPVYYPLPGQLVREWGNHWQRARLDGVGMFLPPSDLYALVGRHPRLARTLLWLEKRTARHWPFKYMSDHYWLEMHRKADR